MSEQYQHLVYRDWQTGQFLFVLRLVDHRRLRPEDGEDWQEFLKRNATSNSPLDLSQTVFLKDYHFSPDVADLVQHCKDNGVTLSVNQETRRLVQPLTSEFPDKGRLFHLYRAVAGTASVGDGLGRYASGVWVTPELYDGKLATEIQDEKAELRRVTDWPIDRAFVCFDVSDFSQHPPGQQALIIKSLVGMAKDIQCGLFPDPEAMLCIGDGYIFVFTDATHAARFAAFLARDIEDMVACKAAPVEFHFRIGVHVGPVYCFWDTGRENWNYIGDGINGGQRVLSAVGKDKDDAVFVSGELRQQLLTGTYSDIVPYLDNRGRRADKHGKPWRVYEMNHTDLCAQYKQGVRIGAQQFRWKGIFDVQA
jgi:hypothetical protein